MQSFFQRLNRLRIRAYKRYTPFTTSYLGFPTAVIDKSSFLSMADEIYGRELYRFITENPSPYILDCGANIGLSILYFKRLYPSSRIVGFEPDPFVFETLENNIEMNASDGVTIINKGVGRAIEARQFLSEKADGGRIAVKGDENLITIHIEPLSPYIDRKVDMLKIDIEGAELEVLEECTDKLHLVQRMFIEYHSLRNELQKLERILTIIKDAGFRYYIESAGVRSNHPFIRIDTHLGYDNQLNIFCYRS